MKSLRSLIGVVLAFTLATLAMPGAAQNVKQFSLAAAPTVVAGSSKTVVVTFTNLASGNSTFNSVSLTGDPSSSVTITGATTSSKKKPNISPFGSNSLTITDLSPYGAGETLTVTLTVTAPGTTCANDTISWSGSAWTGSPSSPSNQFVQSNPGADETKTTVTSSCSIAFITPPANAVIKQRITGTEYKPAVNPVTVKVLSNGSPVSGVTVNLSASAATGTCSSVGSLTLTGVSKATLADGVATFDALESSTAGACWNLKATRADIASVNTTTSATFDVVNAEAKFSPTPTSVAVEKPSTVTVKLLAGSTVIPQSGSGTLELVEGGCTVVDSSVTTSDGVLVFSVQGVTVGSTCSFRATGEFGGTTFGEAFDVTVSGVKVYTGVLACDTVPFDVTQIPVYSPSDPTMFNASPENTNPPVDGTEDTAFIVGARALGDPEKDDCGVDINFTVVNHVPNGSAASQDPLGNVVPAGGWSFTWDPIVPNPVIGVITTYRSEWANAEGVSENSTWICTTFPCPGSRADFSGDWKKLPYCLSTLVTHSSIPAGEAACLARLVETAVPVGDAAYCEGTPPTDRPVGWIPRCIQPTVYTIIGKDPVFER